MKNTKESISKFFKDLERTIKANKDLVEESKIIRSTKEKFGKSQELKKTSLELTEKIKQSQGKINKLNQELKTKQKEIEDLQKSEKFLKEIEKQQTLEEKKQELENNIDQLRNIIDFKALANFYHNFEKQMKMVKEYREEFKQTFQRTNPQEILDLLKGANIQNNSVLEKIHEIDTKKKEVKEIVLEETGLKDLQRTQDRLKFEINTKSTEKSLREKRLEKIQDNLNEIIGSIKINLKKIDVEFE